LKAPQHDPRADYCRLLAAKCNPDDALEIGLHDKRPPMPSVNTSEMLEPTEFVYLAIKKRKGQE